jgi:hypothetical protein
VVVPIGRVRSTGHLVKSMEHILDGLLGCSVGLGPVAGSIDVADAAVLQEAAEFPTELGALVGTDFSRTESADEFICKPGDILRCFIGQCLGFRPLGESVEATHTNLLPRGVRGRGPNRSMDSPSKLGSRGRGCSSGSATRSNFLRAHESHFCSSRRTASRIP